MRLQKIKEKMKQSNLEGLVITDMKNIFYLTGFSGTAGTVFLTKDEDYFMTDDRYIDFAKSVVGNMNVFSTRSAFSEIAKLAKNIDRIGFEDNLDFATYQNFSSLISQKLIPTHEFFMEFRQIKDLSEIKVIRKACEITDLAFEAVLKFIEPGKSEIEVANFLDFKMRELGASGTSFETIVASGVRSSLPHGVASHKLIENGEAITMDFGCYYNFYASDMTRTVFLGKPNSEMKEIYEVVRLANQALIDQSKATLSFADFDRIPRNIIELAGFGDNFNHGIGHGFGLDIHEVPYFSQKMTDQYLQKNMIVTDEPGIYLSGFGGVRIEDDVLILENGCEVLTKSPKELIVI
ncbi:M24 family metallopeptidase [Lactovum miscens]|uniref:Xaa-Pro aminopeptidase n=1 Tax=Lactovum miscens TaxID=190387 RepID=A0A841C0S0_9LACT|nr:Xaa-Pro peptidase family protein [Lactovum miscens]MBB5887496.1 Xaa-Pro aminopeptidase [Lactovum miscens]